ncbi:hypothetical protein [Cupriavidus gilardii]|uniref:hypothetical protein n=1 Tax=Cupriavidus gilardii TaxID=82541 RepID=UPI001580E596|nr:hypothetical protein [Cupriavidus gilardii]QKS60448.1 hypothetical protein FOB47_02540 [Cupriavidus gilardii]
MDQQDKSGPSYTKGPWFTDRDGNVWRRPPSDLCQNGGGVAGDKPIATVHKGWHGEREVGYPVEANARLIAASPSLYEALRAYVEYTEAGIATDEADAGEIELMERARTALAKAAGSQQ